MDTNNNGTYQLPISAKIDKMMNGSGTLKAYATVTIANCFMIHDVKIIEGSKGPFVSMPNRSYTDKEGQTKYTDICHPITADIKKRLDAAVLNAYATEKQIGQLVDPTLDAEPLPTGEIKDWDAFFAPGNDEDPDPFG